MKFKNEIFNADCMEIMKKIPDEALDFCVSDVPYGISFMGKKWDYKIPSVEIFAELYRILKPGAHILIFGGTRTFHRIVCNIEDANFEIRDCIPWIFGEGFPKNLDVSASIDKLQGAERKVVGSKLDLPGYHLHCKKKTGSAFSAELQQVTTEQRQKASEITAPATDDAKEWQGFGTALKPATELICLARKPIAEKTVAANVLKYGTGALDLDACRIGDDVIKIHGHNGNSFQSSDNEPIWKGKQKTVLGRWPANVMFDEFGAAELGRQADHAGLFFYVAKASQAEKNFGCENLEIKQWSDGRKDENKDFPSLRGATKRQNFHPTVKPLALIKELCNLVSFPGAHGIDPFGGSGTFAIACKELFLNYTLIEEDADYFKIINARLRQGYLMDFNNA